MYQFTRNTYYNSKKNSCFKSWKKNILIIISLILIILFLIGLTSHGNNNVSYIKIKVKPGQTLWNIASDYNTKNEDLRKLIYQIKKINKMDNVILNPGDTIKVPIKKDN